MSKIAIVFNNNRVTMKKIFSFILLAFLLSLFACEPQVKPPVHKYASEYTICNYNIRYYNGTSDNNNKGAKAWPNRKAKVYEMIARYDMDVCGLEEVTTTMANDIAKDLTAYAYIGYGRDNGKQQGSGASGEQTGLIYKTAIF